MKNDYQETKTPIDGMALFYGEYRGNSIGRAIHYLWSICGSNIGDSATFGNNKVTWYGRDLATIDWSKGYPYFTFVGEHKDHYQKRQQELLDGKIDY